MLVFFRMEESLPYDGIILDIDGTIWNTTGVVSVAWNTAIEKMGLSVRKVNAQCLQKEFGKTMYAIAEDLWPELPLSTREILMANCCTEEQIALKNTNLQLTYPGVTETVKSLSSRTSFFVVSNCQSGYIELTLEKTGLTPYIKDTECFGRTKKGKAENLMLLVQRNQLSSPLYIGDTQGDSDACAQAGIPFVWAEYGFGTATQFLAKIKQFSDLHKILLRRT